MEVNKKAILFKTLLINLFCKQSVTNIFQATEEASRASYLGKGNKGNEMARTYKLLPIETQNNFVTKHAGSTNHKATVM